jgi:hypothetical protein
VPVEPGPVVDVEVGPDRADERGPQAELGHAERDVGADATAAYDQVVNEERERDLVQLVGEELLREPTREVHQMVGRDRAGNGDLHWLVPGLSDGVRRATTA